EVRALAGQRVEAQGERGDERLALARLHLGDAAVVERRAADQLHVVVALAEVALRRLAHEREALGQQGVEALAALEVPPPELGVGRGQVLDLLDLGLERVHARDDLALEAPHLAVVVVEQLLDETEHQSLSAGARRPAGAGARRPMRGRVLSRPPDSLSPDRRAAVSAAAAAAPRPARER